MLVFLHLRFQSLAVNIVMGYVTTISHRHTLIDGHMLILDPTLKRWTEGLTHTKGTPTWCLQLFLAMLNKPPFKPLETASLKHLED